jgi:antitoxin component of RelBE/YafQ-DinJ toxin-antitoxin module
MVVMPKTVTVSAKVPEELRRRMSELGIAPSEVIRTALEEAVRRRSLQQLLERAEKAGPIVRKVSKDDWTRAIREDRDAR